MTTRRNKPRRHNPSKARVRAERIAAGTLAPKPAPAKPVDRRPSGWGLSILRGLSTKRTWGGVASVWEGGSRSTRKRAQESKDAARQERRNQKRGA